jgi:hypothetical protein
MQRVVAVVVLGLGVVGLAWAQHDMEHMGHMAMPHATNVKLEVANDEAARVITLRLGPIDLPAHAGMNVAQAPRLATTVPFDGWFTAYHPRLVDDAGKPIPGRLLHHVAVYNLARADFLCPRKPEHIFGAGGEMNDWPATPGIGYRVEQGDKILVATMFHNPTATGYPKVYLEVKMEYQPLVAGGPELKSVYPTWFDVKECGDSSYDLVPGENVTSGEFTLPYSGTLVGLGGHLHDYGHQLQVVDVTRHQDIATLNAELDPQGRMIRIPIVRFTERGGFELAKGDVVKVTATYENPTGKPLPDGAMGIAVGYFLPADDHQLAALKREPH